MYFMRWQKLELDSRFFLLSVEFFGARSTLVFSKSRLSPLQTPFPRITRLSIGIQIKIVVVINSMCLSILLVRWRCARLRVNLVKNSLG